MSSSIARFGRPHLGVLGAAALVGAVAAGSALGATPGPDSSGFSDTSRSPADSRIVAVEQPRPATVDTQMVRSVARQVLLEQGRSEHLTDVDLIARDVLAGGPVAAGDVDRVTRETLVGRGPGGPADTQQVPPPECPATARACIDVDGKRAWLLSGDRVSYGPVPVTTGKPGYETARGSHRVLRHVRHDHSIPFDSPMPFSTYFTTSGMAFHEGRLDEPSHGCIHLGHHAAAHFFEELRVGDEVVAF